MVRLDAAAADDRRLREAAERWMDADPRHAVAFAEASLAWEASCRVRVRDEALTANPDAVVRRRGEGGQVDRLITRRAATGLLAASAVGGIGLGLSRHQGFWADRHHTGRGQQSETRLADGSSIALNTDTTLDVRLGAGQRTVRLIEGEAMFDIARDARRPFVVDLGDARIQVLGTRFNIRRGREQTELTVTRGLVAVTDANGRSVRVGAGETTLIRPDLLATTAIGDQLIRQRISWQEGYIELNDEPLEQAIGEFNRYRDNPIIIADPRLASIVISGRFGVRESADFLTALENSFPIRVSNVPDGSVALSSS